MTTPENEPSREPAESERDGAAGAPPPPANPPVDDDSVEKGEEQLRRVVGN